MTKLFYGFILIFLLLGCNVSLGEIIFEDDFTVDISVLPEYRQVTPGERVVVFLKIENSRALKEPIDISIKVTMFDRSRQVLVESNSETVAILRNISLARSFSVPKSVSSGSYFVVAEVSLNNQTVVAHDSFEVLQVSYVYNLKELNPISSKDYKVGFGMVLFLLILIFFILYKGYNLLKRLEKVRFGRKEEKRLVDKLKVFEQLDSLEKAFEKGAISDMQYQKSRRLLEVKLKKKS